MIESFLKEEQEHYSYCSTQVNIPEPLKSDILRYIEDVVDIADVDDNAGGIEREPHVSILYGIKSAEGLVAIQRELPSIIKQVPQIKIRLNTTSAFETNPDYDVLKVGVESNSLRLLHDIFKRITEWESDYPDYSPHLTLAYLKKGTVKKYVLDDRFVGQEIILNYLFFCNNAGVKTQIDLGGDTNKVVNETPYKQYVKSYWNL